MYMPCILHSNWAYRCAANRNGRPSKIVSGLCRACVASPPFRQCRYRYSLCYMLLLSLNVFPTPDHATGGVTSNWLPRNAPTTWIHRAITKTRHPLNTLHGSNSRFLLLQSAAKYTTIEQISGDVAWATIYTLDSLYIGCHATIRTRVLITEENVISQKPYGVSICKSNAIRLHVCLQYAFSRLCYCEHWTTLILCQCVMNWWKIVTFESYGKCNHRRLSYNRTLGSSAHRSPLCSVVCKSSKFS